jgi:hypothetical protein
MAFESRAILVLGLPSVLTINEPQPNQTDGEEFAAGARLQALPQSVLAFSGLAFSEVA